MKLTKSKKKLRFVNKKIKNANFVKKVMDFKFNAQLPVAFSALICYVGI